MLETMRRQGASIFIYLIFCLLIVIFVINFGPQGGNSGGCRGTSNLTVSVKQGTNLVYVIAGEGYRNADGSFAS